MSFDIEDDSATHASLLIRVRDARNKEAWAEFQRRYGPMIWSWCRHWFPRETEDMVQDVYCKLVERLKSFEYDPAKGRFRGWLKTVTNRLMSDLKDKQAGVPVLRSDSLLAEVEAGQDLHDRLAGEYDLELLEAAKLRVSGRVEARTWSAYKELAEHGRDPVEVAEALGFRVGAVYQAKHRVLAELKREIQSLESRD
jgi:RNA polymerase sigma-70 factor (ECF subfamily)